MRALLTIINRLLTELFDLFFWPFERFDPIWGMVGISLLSGVLMVWIFGKVSNQEAIRLIRNRIRGNLIGVRLFQNDIRVLLGIQKKILRDTLTYMKYSLIPMLVIIIPVILIIIQLNLRFSARPLQPGERTLVKVKLRDTSLMNNSVVLQSQEGVKVETPSVRIKAEKEVAWRIVADHPGRFKLIVRATDQTVEKELIVGAGWRAVSAVRTGKNLLEMLLYPGEPPIDRRSPVESVEVKYPRLSMTVFGWNIHWLFIFFVLSIAFGFAVKGFMGVEV